MTIAALAPRVAHKHERLSSIDLAKWQTQTQLTKIDLLLARLQLGLSLGGLDTGEASIMP